MDGTEEFYFGATVDVLTRLRLSEIDAEWVLASWDSQFTECGDIPADYDDDVLADSEVVLKIVKKVSNGVKNLIRKTDNILKLCDT